MMGYWFISIDKDRFDLSYMSLNKNLVHSSLRLSIDPMVMIVLGSLLYVMMEYYDSK